MHRRFIVTSLHVISVDPSSLSDLKPEKTHVNIVKVKEHL